MDNDIVNEMEIGMTLGSDFWRSCCEGFGFRSDFSYQEFKLFSLKVQGF